MRKPGIMSKNAAVDVWELTRDSETIANFELSRPRMREFDVWPGGSISLRRLHKKDAEFVAVLYGPNPQKTKLLGFSDDLGKIIEACSNLASREAEQGPDGKTRIVTGAELMARFATIAPKIEPLELSPAQIACATTYGNGDFAHLIDLAQQSEREYQRELAGSGDPLFRFLMNELDPREDCDSDAEALHRLEMAVQDIIGVKAAIELIPEPKP